MTQARSWLRRMARDYAISVAFWLVASVLVGSQMYALETRADLPVRFEDVLLLYAVRYLSVALLTPPVFYIVNRWPVTGHLFPRTIGYALGFVPFSVAFGVIRWLMLPPWMEETMSWGPRNLDTLWQLIYATFADLLLLYLGVVVAAHAYAYFVRGQRQEIERLQLRQSLAQSELQTLRAQLHPHFMFNTLQGVSTLIDTDRGTAQKMLLTLAGLLRKVLKYGSTDLIAFCEELAFVESYLQLEQMRLGRRLQVHWQIAPGVHRALIPQLLLQPLIENAIVHGIANSREGGWIEIAAKLQQGRLVVVIRNRIDGASPSGLGLGIKNTRARLRYLYGEDAAFEFEIHEARIAVARLSVPAFTAGLAKAVNA
jgi:two-component system, LytTR family, sensor kinase